MKHFIKPDGRIGLDSQIQSFFYVPITGMECSLCGSMGNDPS
jgi:hypothetical protein